MALELQLDYFDMFGLPARFSLDDEELGRAYRDLQAVVHPDRFVNASDAERRVSMQQATQLNEAYRTLKDPVRRAAYLLRRQGIDPELDTNTSMPTAFLMEQMEWREAIEAASGSADSRELDQLSCRLGGELRRMYAQVGQQIDERGDFAGAAETVRKLMFLEKVSDQIGDAMESLEEGTGD
ncbi:MAG: Fe-S protein assembly co-chaperone HscB [Betaproteobacteria bacterium RIFCSPLOWO2_12_FULL_63_13]|nr:MAG: Fe-S protein assembly co-chaperone HscB [Betaproteobacteria bacterium RIFCSPLOWO2_02_FULL_63_19]OGA49607.1 MAG: Fe-S protein assembly co-chaperone HscB [Betaproteobacteria bacterium RIFCSPLOWO2_12_FULL_63_13]